MTHLISPILRRLAGAMLLAAPVAVAGAPTLLEKPAANVRVPAVDAAIEALRRECLLAMKKPGSPLREQCNYFLEHPSDSVSTAAILSALERPTRDDPRVAAYVRWQLLSGLGQTLDARELSRAIELYRQAPSPLPRYGLSKQDQFELDRLIASARLQDEKALNQHLEAGQKKVAEANAPLLAYRDEWYRRLPKSLPTFVAAIEDADRRMKTATGGKAFARKLVDDIKAWTATDDATPKKCAELADMVGQLKVRATPTYYSAARIQQGKLAWVKETDSVNSGDNLAQLKDRLLERANR